MPSPSLILVTGASRGIGREIVRQSIEKVTENSVWILTARKIESLIAVREEIQQIIPNANVHMIPCELSQWNEQSRHDFAELFKKVLTENQDGFDKFYLFHNAGSIGDVKKKSSELSNLSDWSLYLHSNFLSMVAMNNLALEIFNKTHFTSRFIINITSILAIKAFPSTTQYCCGKAIREAFFRSLAIECDDLRILNYSPGPVETDMHDQVANESYDEGMRKMFSKDNEIEASEVHRRKLTTKESVGKMFEILSKNTFISGSRVDFFE